MKTWRRNRAVKAEGKLLIGSVPQLEEALSMSEDSSRLNTAFIERLNLTVRQGEACLCRRTPCHARSPNHLRDHLELLRCYYNFVRLYRALKFGREMSALAIQAGLVSRRPTFPDIFTAARGAFLIVLVIGNCRPSPHRLSSERAASQQQLTVQAPIIRGCRP